MRRSFAIVIVLVALTAGLVARGATGDTNEPLQVQVEQTVQGKPIGWWYRRTQQARKDANARRTTIISQRRTIRALRKTLAHDPSVQESIALACATYGYCSTLWRKASCESHLTSTAHNPSGASGLFQFMPSTFASTPYAGLSIWSPYANALAAGWMHEHGRGGEWVCR
jgi:hypothetical protein